MSSARVSAVVSDADVLIDFVKTDTEVLTLLATKLWDVYVPVEVLGEVDGLETGRARDLGLLVYEATLEELTEVATNHGGALSDRDRLCFCIARDHGWACLTNDQRLRRECLDGGVPVVRSLQSLRCLYESGLLSADRTAEMASAFHRVNPHFITAALVRRFLQDLSI